MCISRNWQVTLLLYTLGVFLFDSSLKLFGTTRLSRGFHQTKRPWRTMKLEFDSDNGLLGKILFALANAEKITPEFRISYTVKDPEASKNALPLSGTA